MQPANPSIHCVSMCAEEVGGWEGGMEEVAETSRRNTLGTLDVLHGRSGRGIKTRQSHCSTRVERRTAHRRAGQLTMGAHFACTLH